jgi:hypothetical protein
MSKLFLESPEMVHPADLMSRFVELFSRKGWLDRTYRIQYRNVVYRILCSRKTFLAYRVNEYYGISPGIAGWPVCILNRQQVFENAGLPGPFTDEPTAYDWLRCLTKSDFKFL